MNTINRSILFLIVIVACGVSAGSSEPNEKQAFCQGCRSIVSFVGNLNKTENRQTMLDVFNDYCQNYYPASTDHQHPCHWFANSVFFIIDRTDPVYHCDQIGACGKPDLSTVNRGNGFTPNSKDNFCNVCQEIVNEAKAVLDSPMAIDMANQQLDVFCNYLSILGLSGECKQQVSKYIDQVVEFVHDIDPLTYCQSLQLCEFKTQQRQHISNDTPITIEHQASTPIVEIEPVEFENSVAEPQPTGSLKGPYCALCKTIVKELFHFLKENKTEENIRDGLDKICQLIYTDKEKVSDCETMVEAYTRELIEFLAAESDPNLVCILIEQCTYQKNLPTPTVGVSSPSEPTILDESEFSQSMPVATRMNYSELLHALEPSYTSFETCLQCKMFIRFLRAKLGQPKTEAEVKEFVLSKLCANLDDKELENSCKNLVNEYADVFFKAVVLELDPQSACVAMAACKNVTLPPVQSFIVAAMRRKNQDDSKVLEWSEITEHNEPISMCNACESMIGVLDEFIAEKEQPFEEGMLQTQFCPRIALPKLCVQMINESEELFITNIHQMKGAKAICREAGYCKEV